MSAGPKKFCGNCGSGLNPGLRFCETCGTAVAPPENAKPASGVGPTVVANLSGSAPGSTPGTAPLPPGGNKVVRPTVPLQSAPGAPTPLMPVPGVSAPGISAPGVSAGGSAPGLSGHPPHPSQHPHSAHGPPPNASYPGGPAAYSAPPFQAPPKKRRWWAALPLLLVIVIVVGAVVAWFGFPLQTRRLLASQGLRTGVGKSRVAGFPGELGADAPHFRRRLVKAPDAPPGEVALATPVYLVEERGASHGPFEVSLPLLDASMRRRVVVARHVDGAWEALPTARDGDHVIASADAFGTFAGWTVRRRSSPTADERTRLVVPTPRLLFARLEGEQLSFHVDIRGLNTATSPDSPWSDRVAVRGLHVEVARPAAGADAALETAFGPYPVEGGDLLWSPGQAVGILPIALTSVDASVRADTPVSHRAWLLRVHPVFEDGTTGPPTQAIRIYPELVRAYAQMIRNTPWPAGPREAFLSNTAQHPLTIGVGEGFVENAYRGSLAWTRQRSWGWIRAGFTGPQVTMTPDATFGQVATHAYGHYATHMALGDDYLESIQGRRHGWLESSREAAFTEDLATVLGELATGDGVPAGAGAMLGRPRDLARNPPDGLANAWPLNRTQDALAVETVPATVMSRLASDIGAETVTGAVLSSHATDLLALIDALPAAHRETARRVMMDEGISWTMRGQVTVDGSPVVGALVRVENADGHAFALPSADRASASGTTDAEGRYTVRVPYGTSRLLASSPGLRQLGGPREVEATATRSTASEPEQVEPLLMERAGPTVALTSPRSGEVVRSRSVLVEGTVTGDGVQHVVLRSGDREVQVTPSGGRFSGRMVMRPGENVLTAAAVTPGGEGTASVTVNAMVPAAALVAELTWDRDATDLDLRLRPPGQDAAAPRTLENSRGFGPELVVLQGETVGEVPVEVRYESGRGAVSFTVRWCVHEGTPQARCGEERGQLAGPGTRESFVVQAH
ncbi:MAG: hypothetical protein AB8I08_01060 [Sandaracinaceae bacterium]